MILECTFSVEDSNGTKLHSIKTQKPPLVLLLTVYSNSDQFLLASLSLLYVYMYISVYAHTHICRCILFCINWVRLYVLLKNNKSWNSFYVILIVR